MLQRKVVAITGGTGCIGVPLTEQLLALGNEVRVIARCAEGFERLPESRQLVKVRTGVESSDALREAFRGCEVVFHLAATVHNPEQAGGSRLDVFRTNTWGTARVLLEARSAGVGRVVFGSSIGVYGMDASEGLDEGSALRPRSDYALSKVLAEELGWLLAESSQWTVVRMPVSYGAYDRGNMARLIVAVARGRFVIAGDGSNRRSLIGSRNAAQALILASAHPKAGGRVFCVSDGPPVELTELARTIESCLGGARVPSRVPRLLMKAAAALGSAAEAIGLMSPFNRETYNKLFRDMVVDDSLIRRELGYAPAVDLQAGIQDEVDWLRSEGMI